MFNDLYYISKVLESKIDADCSKIALLKGIIGKSPEERWLSNWTIAHDDYFKKIIVLLYHSNKVVNMQDSMIVFDNDSVLKLKDIKAIKVPGIKLNYILYNYILF